MTEFYRHLHQNVLSVAGSDQIESVPIQCAPSMLPLRGLSFLLNLCGVSSRPCSFASGSRQLFSSCKMPGGEDEGESLRIRKKTLRKNVTEAVTAIPLSRLRRESCAIMHNLQWLAETVDLTKEFKGVSVFLSMPSGELNSWPIFDFFCSNKAHKVFVPKVVGRKPQDMVMVPVSSLSEVLEFPKNKWGISEPPDDLLETRRDGTYSGEIDMVVCPGVAFDAEGNRCGHGKGYYDCFLERVSESNEKMGKRRPVTLALSLQEQLVEEAVIPVDSFDVPMDLVVTPLQIFVRRNSHPLCSTLATALNSPSASTLKSPSNETKSTDAPTPPPTEDATATPSPSPCPNGNCARPQPRSPTQRSTSQTGTESHGPDLKRGDGNQSCTHSPPMRDTQKHAYRDTKADALEVYTVMLPEEALDCGEGMLEGASASVQAIGCRRDRGGQERPLKLFFQ
uniref:5-formyltetrahydrofolate cyclo-ligase n=1 Tax=Chromera velia CCMP2878 TaxID=1169474 RepID=A0A0G4HSL4_9ALVE|eukprot:Cvel_31125.t1-p1 / transcript=Cvel_31125.t1 / gene=Cvel_31125 / organism=Chromera_velia_CCMP2878 / gene_product=5-formyltetrahydrofolate cyclo-ligase, putative / transcript_product=5-formyltetrahydrofolate cyclo-ligase, putative / location=Cvel_scaffold4575:2144-6519(+) / protein_length=450 / sequence_SO=supercontig / SO=protein_coding / is_pseudo=false